MFDHDQTIWVGPIEWFSNDNVGTVHSTQGMVKDESFHRPSYGGLIHDNKFFTIYVYIGEKVLEGSQLKHQLLMIGIIQYKQWRHGNPISRVIKHQRYCYVETSLRGSPSTYTAGIICLAEMFTLHLVIFSSFYST